ncbi:MAG: dTDP-glucose 4,6-dehydratase [Bradyrhizobiaceae bacterium]|nr:MAG: dTDP-glucose 4,6-dehydratase [Bradyrhizobiaceae bacterium]
MHTLAQAFDASENIGRNNSDSPSIQEVVAARLNRRAVLKGTLGIAVLATTVGPPVSVKAAPGRSADIDANPRFKFDDIGPGGGYDHQVANGYDADILIRWGDPVLPGAPAFDPASQNAGGQRLQFGYNNDFLGYLPMPGAANPSHHGLLVVNFEYTSAELMLPRAGQQDIRTDEDIADIEMAAHGGAVIEVERAAGKWRVVAGSKFARRIDVETPIEVAGPAAGHDRLKTQTDPSGRHVRGMLNNCGGGITPWGTWLSCEENFHGYFWGEVAPHHREAGNFKRYGVRGQWYEWGRWHDRFDLAKEPNEANRFGWVVEIDPFDPTSTPKKRTALGRFKHEGAAGIVNKDGRYVIYMGDDESFEYVYRFVTAARVHPPGNAANRNILDDGVLSVARFNADGTLDWLPLVHGHGLITEANGFASRADVLIETRRAADLLGATKMDRPEDVEANPRTGRVYVSLTNNAGRTADQVDAANPSADNRFGHIVEMTPADGDHTANRFTWDILLKCGDPSIAPEVAASSASGVESGWLAMPDNIAVDAQGRLWIATDGNTMATTGRTDGLWGLETEGLFRGRAKQFYRVPAGGELCGPVFTPDDETLFVAVQHPGEPAGSDPGTQDIPLRHLGVAWPDFRPGIPPRPSVVAITKRGGGKIAT